ncbi:aldehyde dehydrogenase family protein [Winogradskyella sp. UBA3174]|uniref:aldehyde dehydrogenase family protein n=1 Tax=Winogradskyella sp. UBA3174 TaxID=1947785 RepID=UPI0025D2F51D|nr:aldehyde dehydrogenase family protein [Winogradskyella sp. UBA3174]|tara:strand:- start:33601 stop:35013 length:1413 start_codon:yes stop_codon:yes gene_type:complete
MVDFRNNTYFELFSKQNNNQLEVGQSTYSQRIKNINALQRAIEFTFRDQIKEALYKDLGKPAIEADLTEVYPIIGDIKHVKKYLHQWMRKQKVKTTLSMLGASSYYIHESKGVCLIISPWNFPFNLTFGPLVAAIAAGNTVIIKPSEMTPHSSALMAKIITEVFTENEVALVEGEVEVSTELLKLPFNHIFFTGSPNVGKIVMTAAAKNLSSLTLELGGKSPIIVDATANIDMAAKKIMWGKFLNCGQICVAPDYVLIDESIKAEFITACKKWLSTFYRDKPESSSSYGRIVTDKHLERLKLHIENAKELNAIIEVGGDVDASKKYIAPTIISDLKAEATLLAEEIFGPILPIVTYKDLNEAIDYINTKERPLALYIYSKNRSNTKKIIVNTRAGGTCINNNIIHYANHYLPFGGVNNSGIGKSHGFFGFEAFSNKRAIVEQHTFGATEFLFPPYTGLKEKMARFTIKWF